MLLAALALITGALAMALRMVAPGAFILEDQLGGKQDLVKALHYGLRVVVAEKP